MATNVKILLRRGLRNEITANTLDAGELGYTTDTNQLYVGTADSSDEIVFDPFANAQSIVQTYLNLPVVSGGPTEQGREIDEDLIIRNVSDVPALLTAMEMYGIITAGAFVIGKEYKIKTTGTTDYTAIGSSVLTSGNFVVGTQYTILTTGTTDFTSIGAANSDVDTTFVATRTDIIAGSFEIGESYTIVSSGTTDFTLIGATDSITGTVFTATGVGTGTGIATNSGTGTGTGTALLSTFTATGVGTGNGTAIDIEDHFYANIFASERKNVEVLTENSFSQVYANMHLQTHTAADGRRPDLFKKELTTTSGTFLKYAKTDSTSFFIDYSLKQTDTTNTFVRVGTIRVINGEAITPTPIPLAKLTDDNTEIWQDEIALGGDGDNIADADEFSNIEFTTDLTDGVNMKINYTQDANFTTEISYTIKRWTM